MVTAVSGFIEQVGSMNKGIPKHKYHQPPHNSIKLQRATTDTCQQANLYKFIGNYSVQNWIIASRWLHMSVSTSMMDCGGVD